MVKDLNFLLWSLSTVSREITFDLIWFDLTCLSYHIEWSLVNFKQPTPHSIALLFLSLPLWAIHDLTKMPGVPNRVWRWMLPWHCIKWLEVNTKPLTNVLYCRWGTSKVLAIDMMTCNPTKPLDQSAYKLFRTNTWPLENLSCWPNTKEPNQTNSSKDRRIQYFIMR